MQIINDNTKREREGERDRKIVHENASLQRDAQNTTTKTEERMKEKNNKMLSK